MWNWIKNVAAGVKPPALLPAEQLDYLRADLGRLDALRAGISRRLVDFILTGENEGVLAEAAGLQGASGAVEMKVRSGWHTPQKFDARKKFFGSLDTKDVPFLLRLAFVFDAISQSDKRDLKIIGIPSDAAWLEVFLWEVMQYSRNTWPANAEVKTKIRAETIEEMLKADEQNTDLLVKAALWIDPTKYGYSQQVNLFLAIPGIAGSFERHPGAIRESLLQKDYRARVHALEFLGKAKVPLAPVLDDIVQAGVASAKQVQEAATTLLFGHVAACLPRLREYAINGDNDERLRAVRLLWKLSPQEAKPFLEQRLKEDKSKKIVAVIEELLVPAGADATAAESPVKFEMPAPVPFPDPMAPLPEGFATRLEEVFKKASQASDAGWERIKNEKWARSHRPFTAPPVRKIMDFLEGRDRSLPQKAVIDLPHWAGAEARKILNDAIACPGCTLLHAVRWCILLMGGEDRHHYWLNRAQPILSQFTRQQKITIDLRELAAIFTVTGLPADLIGISCLSQNRYSRNPMFKLPPEKIWPYFAERMEVLEKVMGMKLQDREGDDNWLTSDYWIKERRLRALGVLAAFPTPPAQFLPLLWELALGTAKQEREPAQDALATLPGKEAKIIASLANGQQDVRANAAAWIERLKITSAIPALEAALKKEKSEVVKGALFDALEALDVPLDPYLNREKLADEAAKGLSKGIPKELEWFPFAQLPAVHWQDTGKAVPPDVIKWFLVQACKLKEPAPTPLLRRYAQFFKKTESAALGKFILQSWITQDTLPAFTHDEAAAKADAGTKQMLAYIQGHPQYANFYKEWSEQKHYKGLLNNYLNTCKGSATDSKGILAVACACAGGDVTPIVQRYLKQWYGLRHSQGKALVQMLSAVDHPSAIQLLLSVGNRFRTKGIQEEAARACEALAERKGWSLDELADRTIPTAGFDEKGILELPYGTRTFTAQLGPDFEIVLRNPEDKEISALPEPNKADDEAVAKESKQRLSAARKELKGILKLQLERLYEAMCTQRTWAFQDWDTYLNRHTIVGSYVQRLVWGVVENGAIKRLFRPLPDGSLTDEQDNAVTLPAEAVIRMAHDALLTPEQRAAWTAHLSDYGITPLFAQFGRPKFELTAERKEQLEIKDFHGYLIEAFKLRGRMTKQGYARGQALDGGWWCTYHKRFLGLGIEAVIEFSGSPMPEENRTVALISLAFSRLGEEGRAENENIPLGELPIVLLTECWNDLRAAAAEGSGFDAEWEKKTSY
ncbi:MAG TPA: DUF4132 domain-containing protein [Chthoniobacteraceae bacterium]|nr:DUF4132 domain-containing protein [Chthoniobacteraceae bacterium]